MSIAQMSTRTRSMISTVTVIIFIALISIILDIFITS